MVYKLTIPERLPSLNDYIKELGKHPVKGNQMKQRDEYICVSYIRNFLRGVKITKPIIIHYHFFEPNAKRDRMNVYSYADKVFEDALQRAKVIKNDGWWNVINTSHRFDIDPDNPRVEIEIEEVEIFF